jgi:RNase H-fold protein (predicted Holliday junction resolvase)
MQAVEMSCMNEGRRIPPFAEDTLALLTEAAGGVGEELPKEEALEIIAADERFDVADANAALEILQKRGYIYYVEESVRITPTDK